MRDGFRLVLRRATPRRLDHSHEWHEVKERLSKPVAAIYYRSLSAARRLLSLIWPSAFWSKPRPPASSVTGSAPARLTVSVPSEPKPLPTTLMPIVATP